MAALFPQFHARECTADPETGCNQCDASAQQECRQAYYLKQQNTLLKSGTATSSGSPQLEELGKQNQALQQQISLQQKQLDSLSTNHVEIFEAAFFALIAGFVIAVLLIRLSKKYL
jgi:hypothetical protein